MNNPWKLYNLTKLRRSESIFFPLFLTHSYGVLSVLTLNPELRTGLRFLYPFGIFCVNRNFIFCHCLQNSQSIHHLFCDFRKFIFALFFFLRDSQVILNLNEVFHRSPSQCDGNTIYPNISCREISLIIFRIFIDH